MKVKNTIGYEELNPNNVKIKCSIIIPVYNNYNFTKACLKDLSKLSYEYEVIVVDNASDDNTINLELLPKEDLPCRFVYLRNDFNAGFSRASNRGFSIANGEYILFLNNDIRVKKEYGKWVEPLLKEAEDGSLVGVNVGAIDKNFNFINEYNPIEILKETLTPGIVTNVKMAFLEKINSNYIYYLSGWCLCASKKTFNKLKINDYIGPFSEEFWTYFEDTDLSIRADKINIIMKAVYVPVTHFGKMTSKKVGLQNLYSKAKIIFLNKWKNKI